MAHAVYMMGETDKKNIASKFIDDVNDLLANTKANFNRRRALRKEEELPPEV